MNGHFAAVRLLVSLAVISLLAACAAGSSPTPPPSSIATSTPSAPAATPMPIPTAAAPTPAPTLAADVAALDVPYETSNPLGRPEKLDVYAPSARGPWPVVVMFHGNPAVIDKGYLARWATHVAADGFVVFVPTWGKVSSEATADMAKHDELIACGRQAACAVAFARAHAAEYGGDPSTMILFGHSAGANTAAYLAFARPQPTDGCPGGDALGPVSSIVTFEGDWLDMDPMWDPRIAADPAVLVYTPWEHLAEHPDVPVVMLVSEGSGGVLEPPALDPPVDWLTARDPVALRERFLAAGERADVAEQQAILHAALEAQGNPVSLTALPGADHSTIGVAGMPVLLAAFHEAAGK